MGALWISNELGRDIRLHLLANVNPNKKGKTKRNNLSQASTAQQKRTCRTVLISAFARLLTIGKMLGSLAQKSISSVNAVKKEGGI